MSDLREIQRKLIELEEREDMTDAARAEVIDIRLELNDVRRTLELAGVDVSDL